MKIGILLPLEPTASDLWLARALSSALVADAAQRVHVAVGLPTPDRTWQARAAMISEGLDDVIVRALAWEFVESSQAVRMYPGLSPVEGLERLAVPKDWGWNFTDCDLWLVIGDARVGGIVHLKPTAVICRDLAARYVPGSFAPDMRSPLWDRQIESFLAWRQVECVVAPDPATLEDVVSYAGVARARTRLVPPLWAMHDVADAAQVRTELSNAILWITEPGPVYDNETVLQALRRYVAQDGDLRIVVAGERVALLDPRTGDVNQISRALAKAPELLARISFESIVSIPQLDRLVAGAAVVCASSVADGQPDVIPAAFRYRKPLVACDYPQMRRAAEVLSRPTFLYPIGDVERAFMALLHAEAQAKVGPSNERAEFPLSIGRDCVVGAYAQLIGALATYIPA